MRWSEYTVPDDPKLVIAIGEAKAIGLVTEQNLDEALASNFGDIGPKDLAIDFAKLKDEVANALTC